MDNKFKTIFDQGRCRCCGSLKRCCLLNDKSDSLGDNASYSDMIMNCFGISLSHLDSTPIERLVCMMCIEQIVKASLFRAQVLHCEEMFLKMKSMVGNAEYNNIKMEGVELQELSEIKTEPSDDESVWDKPLLMDGDDFSNSMPLSERIRIKKTTNQQEQVSEVENESCNTATCDSDSDYQDRSVKNKPKKEISIKKLYSPGKRRGVTVNDKDDRVGVTKMELVKLKKILDLKETGKDKKSLELSHKQMKLINMMNIVQNSYVCPFDSRRDDYYCYYCKKVFSEPVKLREHTLTHDPQQFLDCLVNKEYLQLDIFRIDCRNCPENINNIEDLKTHLTVHGKQFHPVTKDILEFKLDLKNFNCVQCDVNYPNFHTLKKHMAEHFGPIICDVCGVHLFSKIALRLHQNINFKVKKIFPCTECSKTFKSNNTMKSHVFNKHYRKPNVQCNKCNSLFFTIHSRYRHMIEVHGEERSFHCALCDRVYDTKKSLREHKRRSHLKLYKHQCELCEKRFYTPSRMKEHMLVHAGVRDTSCEYCDKRYPSIRGLRVHMKSAHANEKRRECGMCDASFTSTYDLNNHMKKKHHCLEINENEK